MLFDFKFSTPIKQNFDDRNTFYILPSFSKQIKIYLKLSEANLNDDYLRFQESTSTKFFEVENRLEDLQILTLDSVIDIGIFIASTRDTYSRTVFSIFDLFGAIGGLYGLMSSIWGFIVGFIATHIMLSSVFRRLYFTNISNTDDCKLVNCNESKKRIGIFEEDHKEENRK